MQRFHSTSSYHTVRGKIAGQRTNFLYIHASFTTVLVCVSCVPFSPLSSNNGDNRDTVFRLNLNATPRDSVNYLLIHTKDAGKPVDSMRTQDEVIYSGQALMEQRTMLKNVDAFPATLTDFNDTYNNTYEELLQNPNLGEFYKGSTLKIGDQYDDLAYRLPYKLTETTAGNKDAPVKNPNLIQKYSTNEEPNNPRKHDVHNVFPLDITINKNGFRQFNRRRRQQGRRGGRRSQQRRGQKCKQQQGQQVQGQNRQGQGQQQQNQQGQGRGKQGQQQQGQQGQGKQCQNQTKTRQKQTFDIQQSYDLMYYYDTFDELDRKKNSRRIDNCCCSKSNVQVRLKVKVRRKFKVRLNKQFAGRNVNRGRIATKLRRKYCRRCGGCDCECGGNSDDYDFDVYGRNMPTGNGAGVNGQFRGNGNGIARGGGTLENVNNAGSYGNDYMEDSEGLLVNVETPVSKENNYYEGLPPKHPEQH